MTLTWKASWTGNDCRIFSGKIIAGFLKTSSWNGNAYGELHGYMLLFKPLGFWKKETQILDIEGKRELGKIKYNFWKNSAVITYEQTQYDWKYNVWSRKTWELKGSEESASFSKSGFWKNEGTIESEDISGAVILAAMYVNSYFSKITAAVQGL